MSTGSTDSLNGENTVADSASQSVHGISQRTIMVAVALLAVLGLIIFRLNAHASGQDNAYAGVNTGLAQNSDQTAPTAGSQDSVDTSDTNSSVNIKLNSSSSSNSTGTSSSSELTVNGQAVESNDGNVHYSSDDGKVHVNISSSNHTSGGGDAD